MNFVVAVGVCALVVYVITDGRRRRRRIWRDVAAELGLRFERRGWSSATDAMSGDVDGVPTRVEGAARMVGDKHEIFTRVSSDAPALQGLTLEKEGLGTRVAKMFGGEDHIVGDPPFDDSVRVRGDQDRCLATLGADQRAAALTLLDTRTRPSRNGLQVSWEGRDIHQEAGRLRGAIEAVTDAARPFRTLHPIAQGLTLRARTDPASAVRVNALNALAARHGGSETQALLDELSQDGDPLVAGAVRRLRGQSATGGLALVDERPTDAALSLVSEGGELSAAGEPEAVDEGPEGRGDRARRPKQRS